MRNAVVCFVAVVGLLAPLGDAGIIYVDDDAPPGGDGLSWTTAFAFLQDALAVAQFGDEIRVAGGVYYPDRDAANPTGTGNRDVSFNLISGVAIYGGYAGLSLPSDPDHRDLQLYLTTLSGNIGSPTETSDNSRHVVTAIDTPSSTLLDGLTITAGCGLGDPYSGLSTPGMGFYASNAAQLILRRCTIANNVGGTPYWYETPPNGAGIYCQHTSLELLTCTIAANSSENGAKTSDSTVGSDGGPEFDVADHAVIRQIPIVRVQGPNGGSGGGIYATSNSLVRAVSTAFVANRSGTGGEGTHVDDGGAGGNGGAALITGASHFEAVDCLFSGNQAGPGGPHGQFGGYYGNGGHGGDIFVEASASFTAINCLMTGSRAGNSGRNGGNGGSIYTKSALVRLITCTLTDDSAGQGGIQGQPGHGGALFCDNAVPVVTNSILWLAAPEAVAGEADISFSDVQGGWPGTGNISGDPLFVDPNGPDNDPNTWADNDFRLSAGSPCIDAGSNLAMPRDVYDLDGDGCVTELLPVDLDGFVRYIDDPNTPDTGLGAAPLVDMGAYEFGATQPPVGGPCPGDLNCDSVINFDDINPFVLALSDAAAYQAAFPNCFVSAADCNNDSVVNFDDINPFVALLSG